MKINGMIKLAFVVLFFGLGWYLVAADAITDAIDLGNLGDPNHSFYQHVRDDRRKLNKMVVNDVDSTENPKKGGDVVLGHQLTDPMKSYGTKPDQFYDNHAEAAQLIRGFTLAERKIIADAKGIRLNEEPDATVDATDSDWQMVSCKNVGTNRYEPCESFPGDTVEGFGIITNDKVRLISNGKMAQIGPDGITDTTPVTQPRIVGFPRFALLGQMVDAEGNVIEKPFVIGSGHTLDMHGFLMTLVNADYYFCYGTCGDPGVKLWPHPLWYDHNHGRFGLRLRRNKH